jgi:cephalosporin hydroxylase
MFAQRWHGASPATAVVAAPNPLREFFDARKEGRGIWKWLHYFDIYHRHFQRFAGQPVRVLEIGIYSGGSLEMWLHYFGAHCQVYGVDIEPACTAYESEQVRVFVGDQSDRAFWARVREAAPVIDIVIDDGGHHPEQQIATLEELLPHLQPGGVYVCEDVDQLHQGFADYMHGLIQSLHAFEQHTVPEQQSPKTAFQRAINSIHIYPFAYVVERTRGAVEPMFQGPRHGTEWQPFPAGSKGRV